MSAWFNYVATAKILIFGLLVGAVLPALFAAGVWMHAAGAGVTSLANQPAGQAAGTPRRPVLTTLSWLIFAVVLAMVIVGVLFIARDFIGQRTGWYIFGAEAT